MTAALGVEMPETTRSSPGLYVSLSVVMVMGAAAANGVKDIAAVITNKTRELANLILFILLSH